MPSTRPHSRRSFLGQAATLLGASALPSSSTTALEQPPAKPELHERIEGLLVGSFIGDALGGPVEFQDPKHVAALDDPPKRWAEDEVLDESAIDDAAARLRLRSYSPLRPQPEPYGQWNAHAPAGTVTDDSRHKLVLLDALRHADQSDHWPLDASDLARAYLAWPRRGIDAWPKRYTQLREAWLREWWFASRWVLGERKFGIAYPPERLWNGLPTCCGQMALPPLAAVFPGEPLQAYRAAFQLAYFDNGWGKDLNAAFVAALSVALVTPAGHDDPSSRIATWQSTLRALRETDPFAYGDIPWTRRSVDRWLHLAHELVRQSHRQPASLFAALDREFMQTIKWEAQVPFVVTFAVLELANFHPLAALQLSIEWGHDTDSYAQMVGALVGAMHGANLFPARLRQPVEERIREDYGEDLTALVALLQRCQQRQKTGR